ncbi:hypothetical protein LAZ67_8003571 [Cordylochernes scorpioides]|uniref:Uncharacterized protein n=1 Tax=Cordylochernes scorpioides TaxID=51811 RepID=A0ABY6KTM1_9ARAC|nr:hypothetical protein LAZ67_8003571 [Cordylochernes scorpioides]
MSVSRVRQSQSPEHLQSSTHSVDNLFVGCSGYNRFNQCVHDVIEPKCGAETVQYSTQMFEMIATTMPRTIFSNFQDDSCDHLLPPSTPQPEGSQSKSFLARLLSAFLSNYLAE